MTVAAIVTVAPALGFIAACVRVVAGRVSAFELEVGATMYALTIIGVEVGFHRIVAHRGASARNVPRLLLLVLGSMAAQGPLAWWVATHRRHHERSDRDGDPHSPRLVAGKPLRGWSGFWHAHLGWMWREPAELDWSRYARDVLRDRLLFFVHRSYFYWIVLGFALPGAIGFWHAGYEGALGALLWGGLVRMFLVHNAMWSVASVCHLYGSRPYEMAGDHSRNNAWLALFTFGESWHNNHHAFPSSVRHGLEWWQLDLNYIVIRMLSALRCVQGLKLPSSASQRSRRHASPPTLADPVGQ
jgi:stearoyl-CoA desaturase (delta-9 desaturase)